MIVINTAEFRGNMKKYLDLAGREQVIIQRGRNETYEIVKKQPIKEPNADFHRAVSADQMLEWVLEDIDKMYKLPR
jgi:hypothetical protein